jgi:hypothetical protein
MKTYLAVWAWLNAYVFGGRAMASHAKPQIKPKLQPQLGFFTACMVSREYWPHN